MRRASASVLLLLAACTEAPREQEPAINSSGGSTSSTTAPAVTTAGADTSTSTTEAATTSSTGDDLVLDVGGFADIGRGPSPTSCTVVDDMDGIGDCKESSPPGSFDPVIQWTYTPEDDAMSHVMPLVANLTDDDRNGSIDLCDVPDVVVVVGQNTGQVDAVGEIHVLDGATGDLHMIFDTPVYANVTPALGDIDDDGVPEIVTLSPTGAFLAFEHDGTLKWERETTWQLTYVGGGDPYSTSVAMADLDNDGDVEIIASNQIVDHGGEPLILPAESGQWSVTTAADLDGDGDLEVILGRSAYHHDGTVAYALDIDPGYPHVADLDLDGLPEVLLTSREGLTLIEHDGTITFEGLRPTGEARLTRVWNRPGTIHDFDGDGEPEFASGTSEYFTAYERDGSILWSEPVSDYSGIASGTAFDFLGSGFATAMYADEQQIFVFGEQGELLMQSPRTSSTLAEYPVVADVDNDGSAEIIYVSNLHDEAQSPTVQVVSDASDRWIQARRIWNQHSYHVTNVREDGTIPQFEPPNWETLNTFRSNAQIEGGDLCVPPAG
ncbi:MAG: VCBS repeat-containing protein [Myxococcota bacterium]